MCCTKVALVLIDINFLNLPVNLNCKCTVSSFGEKGNNIKDVFNHVKSIFTSGLD